MYLCTHTDFNVKHMRLKRECHPSNVNNWHRFRRPGDGVIDKRGRRNHCFESSCTDGGSFRKGRKKRRSIEGYCLRPVTLRAPSQNTSNVLRRNFLVLIRKTGKEEPTKDNRPYTCTTDLEPDCTTWCSYSRCNIPPTSPLDLLQRIKLLKDFNGMVGSWRRKGWSKGIIYLVPTTSICNHVGNTFWHTVPPPQGFF